MKSDFYYQIYAKRCELIGCIIEDLGMTAEANGRYEQFLLQRVEIFEFLEHDSLTLIDLRDFLQTEEFDRLIDHFGLVAGV